MRVCVRVYADERAGHVHEQATACLPAGHWGEDGLSSSSGAAATTTAQAALLAAQIWDWGPFDEFKISSSGRGLRSARTSAPNCVLGPSALGGAVQPAAMGSQDSGTVVLTGEGGCHIPSPSCHRTGEQDRI